MTWPNSHLLFDSFSQMGTLPLSPETPPSSPSAVSLCAKTDRHVPHRVASWWALPHQQGQAGGEGTWMPPPAHPPAPQDPQRPQGDFVMILCSYVCRSHVVICSKPFITVYFLVKNHMRLKKLNFSLKALLAGRRKQKYRKLMVTSLMMRGKQLESIG